MWQKLQTIVIIILTVNLSNNFLYAGEGQETAAPFRQEEGSGGTVSGGDAAGDMTLLQAEETVAGEVLEKAVVFSVTVPESLDFVMDPYRLGGQGSIWSQEYSFVNRGSTPVKICIRDIHCTAAEDISIVEDEESVECRGMAEDGKIAALWLDMDNGDQVQITEKAAAYEVILEPEEAVVFCVRGEMSAVAQWRSGDICLSMLYRIEALGPEG